MSTANSDPTRKIYPLTSLRFFAAFLVVFHHTAHAFLPAFRGASVEHLPEGFLKRLPFSLTFSVSFFYLLSGYVLSLVYLRGSKPLDAGRFFWARFARIYPLYLVMIVLSTPAVLRYWVRHDGLNAGVTRTAEMLVAHLTMVAAWYPNRLVGIDTPSWSLCGEAFFYACFCLFGARLWRLRGAGLWGTALSLYVGGQALVWLGRVHVGVLTLRFWPPFHLTTFVLGILLARWQTLQREDSSRAPVRPWQANLVLGVSLCGIMASVLLLYRFNLRDFYDDGMLAPILGGIIWVVSAAPTGMSRLLGSRWLVALGNGSYALYLINIPMLFVFQAMHWTAQALYPVYLALCVGLSVASFHYFETPVRLWLVERFHLGRRMSKVAAEGWGLT
jgi:peptidoglycan/LPS O-acetylase OafA/YrhL